MLNVHQPFLSSFPSSRVLGEAAWRVPNVRASNEGSPRPRVREHWESSGPLSSASPEEHRLHRTRSASKEGTWPLPPHPSEAARSASRRTGSWDFLTPIASPKLAHSLLFTAPSSNDLLIPRLSQKESADCSLLRASSDHRFIVGALRARRTVCLLLRIILTARAA